jgi:hypothetical protein
VNWALNQIEPHPHDVGEGKVDTGNGLRGVGQFAKGYRLKDGMPQDPLPTLSDEVIRRANFRLGHAGRRAWTVSGCLNSAFLDISQHFTGHLFRPWILSSEGRGRKLSWRANALALTLPRVLFVADSNRTSEVLRSFFKVIARPADGNERIQDLDVQGGWYGELA